MSIPITDLVREVADSDKALADWIASRLQPLKDQPVPIRLTVHAGGGKITVQRQAPVHGNGT